MLNKQEYQYKASIIVPIYNVEEFLEDCFASIEKQTIDKGSMEVLLVVDGSPDNSLAICEEKAKENPIYKVFWKENEGLSATRNYGLKRAKGKYIFFLDPDDTYSPNTVENVVSFFEKHYEKVDLVTFPIVPIENGVRKNVHFRYKILKESGVYDLNEFPNVFITQTTINVCVKNRGDNNILFDDSDRNFRQEDQKFNIQNLMDKMKIGFCAEAEYLYLTRSTSIVRTFFYPVYIFEASTAFWESVFNKYPYNEVPYYFQSMLMWDFTWKMRNDILLPYHYDSPKYEKAVGRLNNLLQQVDYRVIAQHPGIDKYHRCYWLQKLHNSNINTFVSEKGLSIFAGEIPVFSASFIKIQICKLLVHKNELFIVAYAKSPIFSLLKKPASIKVIINDEDAIEVDQFNSAHSFFKSKMVTNEFPAFKFRCKVSNINSLRFSVSIDGIKVKTIIDNESSSSLLNTDNQYTIIREGIEITMQKHDRITFSRNKDADVLAICKKNSNHNKAAKTKSSERELKEKALSYRANHNVWLYYDLYTVKKDNGYYQFIHDFGRDDVERYYVYNRELTDIEDQFTDEQKKYLVRFGSEKHKLLYLSASVVLTGYFGFSPTSPFENVAEEKKYKDIINYRVVYLQHGILHADLFRYNSVECGRIDKVVVSSTFEIENFTNKYHFDEGDLIQAGMPRYDHINFESKAERSILFAPSWRKYLTFMPQPSQWNLEVGKLMGSNYFNNIKALLEDKKLATLLEDYDVNLDFKPHPIIANYGGELFQIENDRINIINGDTPVEKYALFITDFSSYVFDYACLKRPIIYFIPDYIEFKSGMNHYRKLDLPLEEAFGNYYYDAKETILEIERIVKRDFKMDDIYRDRVEKFYLPLDNCEEIIYQYVKAY